ncbi:MAG: tetratricopeptide repeat protein [Treponema sp.]|jgi:tetratricopeptide (TPR) repeat protein|nr:tetratricopeptide repeat protein [Treponema sp.]
MKKIKLDRRIFFAGIVLLFFVSCAKTPNTETIRRYARASDAYAAGRFSETAGILEKEKKFPPALILRAKAEYFSGDFKSAEKTCRRALKARPSSFEAKLLLTRVLREKDDLKDAVKSAESLLADNPQDIRALRLAADIAAETGKNDEAAALLDRAAEFSAESAMVLLDRARLRWVAGKGQEALEDLSRARAMLPWDTPLLRTIINLENLISEAAK